MDTRPTTLGALRSDPQYQPRSVKAELRANCMAALQAGRSLDELFPGLVGYAESVLPQVVNAILAGHDLLLLGLRGQAKTRLARCLTGLLDDWQPVLRGDPLRSHPLAPVGSLAAAIIERDGDAAAVDWLPVSGRYVEKLATPDVSVADLIGDIDPIRAQREGYDLGDLRAVTFGLVPRANRGLFCINELPDLAPRIQVSLFNILEEQDVQVRGIPLRLPLDLMLVFTANPEDYTSRGQIITPLKDRIGAQIFTHYPKDREDGVQIMQQEAQCGEHADCQVQIPPVFHDLIEEAARQARVSAYVDQSSGVSARLTISALESLHANVLQRGLRLGEARPQARLVDLPAILAAMTGKVELAYEGEQEGALQVGWHILGEAIKALWAERLPPVIEEGADEREGIWQPILAWFAAGNRLELSDRSDSAAHAQALAAVPGLPALCEQLLHPLPAEATLWQEFLIDGLFHAGVLAREDQQRGLVYSDLLAQMMSRE